MTAATTLAAASALVVGLPATQASAAAIQKVACKNRTDFLKITSIDPRTPQTCFANAGSMPVGIIGVSHVSSGNNAGYLVYRRILDKNDHRYYFGKWHNKPVNLAGVFRVVIY
ncbi:MULTISPECIES: beta/gamma crystallin domain-containing protein [unclassified Streptomyces]|uniref:beta/gamma crystallin domain-containing protein n=1 Tax=unclassified Streptomyces TaxID=2593676 RepID=UPI0013DF1CB5|nr:MULTISPECIES: beta/gamma crystallin domain-containing protein [unclassified Streptomyces]